MSGLELIAVVGCVAAVVSAYKDGHELVKKVRERRRARNALQYEDLEVSLANGQNSVRHEYDGRYRRLGDTFAHGDQEARDTLKDIIIHLQGQVILNLKVAWHQDTNVDALPLQDVSDESQHRAILCLMQLHQRLILAAPIAQISYSPPVSKYNPVFTESSLPRLETWNTQPSSAGRSRSSTIEVDPKKTGRLSGIFRRQKIIAEVPHPHIAGSRQGATIHGPPSVPLKDDRQVVNSMIGLGVDLPAREETLFNGSRVSSMSDRQSFIAEEESPDSDPFCNPWKGAPSPKVDVLERQPFNRSHRRSPEPDNWPNHRVSIHPDTVPQHGSALGHRPSQSSTHSWGSKLSKESSSSQRNSQASSSYSWRSPTFSEPATDRLSQASTSQSSTMSLQGPPAVRHTIMPTGSSRGFLPTEDNDFAGFCKGAWRLQIGEKKKALEEIKRPGSMYSTSSFWKCRVCRFEGHMAKDAKGRKAIDTRVLAANGILYRWEFLFKSHVHLTDALPNPAASTFGCIFCCAEGKGTPTFGGVRNFLAHMHEHRARPPMDEVLYRVGCVIGRTPSPDEAFDIALPAV